MHRNHRMKTIGDVLGRDFNIIISELYLDNQMAAQEISDYLFEHAGVHITCRSIQRQLKHLGIIRSFSAAFNLAIKKGRKSYEHLKKPICSIEFRKGINLKLRYQG